MKKISLCLIVFVMSCAFFMTFVNAEDNIVESPKVKIVIDGQIGNYTDVPLVVNNRTMLPLREVLTNLGVQNDDEHIIWNNIKKSITIVSETKTIVLEVGNKIARVNDDEVMLDVAPIIYSKNNRTYIPARFLAESLGKKVIWDGSSTSVLIRDEQSFNEISSILSKTNDAMEQINKYKFSMDYDFNIDDGEEAIDSKISATVQMDIEKKTMYMNMLMNLGEIEDVPMIFSVESYQVDHTSYSKVSFFSINDQWIKSELSDEEVSMSFEYNSNIDSIEPNDALCAGLVLDDSTNGNEIVLKGDVYYDEYFKQALSSLSSITDEDNSTIDYELDKFHIEMTVDKNTYELSNMILVFGVTVFEQDGTQNKVDIKMNLTYSDYNGNFEIVVPQEVINNAIEEMLDENIKIGAILPNTGPVGIYGIAVENGFNLAVEEINEKGGIDGRKVELITYYNGADAEKSVNALNTLINKDHIVALLGPVLSFTSLAVGPLVEESHIPMITPSATNSMVTPDLDYVYRACYVTPYEANCLAKFASENLGAKNAAILYNKDDDYSVALAEAFKTYFTTLGGTISCYEGHESDNRDFSTSMKKIKEANPDVLFIPNYYNTVGIVAKQAKEMGIDAVMLGGDGWDDVHKEYADVMEGSYYANHFSFDDSRYLTQSFIKSYNVKYGEEPNILAALGYDAARIMLSAIDQADSTDPVKILNALNSQSFECVTGDLTFDQDGNPVKNVFIIKIEGGKLKLETQVRIPEMSE